MKSIFMPVERREFFERHIKQAYRTGASLTVWTIDRKHKIQTTLFQSRAAQGNIRAKIPENFDPPRIEGIFQSTGSTEVYLSLSLPNDTLYFKTKLRSCSVLEGLIFAMPDQVFKFHRRHFDRWTVRTGYVLKLQVEFPNEPTRYSTRKTIDFSAGGLSFFVNPEEVVHYPKGSSLHIKLTLRLQDFHIHGQVQHISRLGGSVSEPRHRVGVRFSHLSADAITLINDYIADEFFKLSARFLGEASVDSNSRKAA